jgi:hypothetical protein
VIACSGNAIEGCVGHPGLFLVATLRGQDALGTAGGTPALPKSATLLS